MMKIEKKAEISIENITVYFSKPVPIDSILHVKPVLLDVGRLYAKIDVEVMQGQTTVGRALIMAQLINR